MAASSSSDPHDIVVDDLYFSALFEDDEIFPISDEKYAEELQLQEAIYASAVSLTSIPSSTHSHEPSSSLFSSKQKRPIVSSELLGSSYCGICMDSKTESEMFRNENVCGHLFCTDCVGSHVAAKIKENIAMVKCPAPGCVRVIEPEICGSIVPKQVLERWEDALCESLILGSERFYCPFTDCSAMMVDDGIGNSVTSAECPNCNRLFCAQCKVPWHPGMDCREYQSLEKGERELEDMLLMDLARNKKWRRCPKCKFFVEKADGCQHISCRCGFHFCYGCGEEHNSSHVCAAASTSA